MVKYCITIFRTMNRQVLNRGMTILAGTVLVTTLMMMAPSVYAASPDFTIETFGIVDGNPSLTVKGTAGGTTPDKPDEIFAYVFFTNKGIFAVTSHESEDSNEVENDIEWHAHKVQLDDNNCVTSLKEQGKAVVDGNTVSVEGTGASTVDKVLTALLVAEGDNVCVEKVFDSQE
jgi:hypothetical protein